ncbi:MAG: DNA starvation/stationary phase protection protein Dps [Dehalococcoidia bacterium]|nr:DNA starvation/stationary phase protection protein Dps [Dehalococcoidia bacterium]
MTTAEPKTTLPAASLETARRSETIAQLNACLATVSDLVMVAKQAHWNVRGPNFEGLHELFELIAVEGREWTDLLAERAVTLGGTAHGTIHDIASATKLAPFPTDEHNWETLAREVHSRMITAAEQLRGFAKAIEDELATQDLCIEIIRDLEKRSWMVDAHLGSRR